jgi:hypothetical protein
MTHVLTEAAVLRAVHSDALYVSVEFTAAHLPAEKSAIMWSQ